jgi:outer membrane protein assembly factor BamD
MESPKRIIAPDITKENQQIFVAAYKASQPGATETATTPKPTGNNEPPRSDQPQAPLQFENVPSGESSGKNGIGVSIVSAPNSAPSTTPAAQPEEDPNAVIKAVRSTSTALPAAEAPAEAPVQVNDIKSGAVKPVPQAEANNKKKKAPKVDQSDESSSKKKKKKGLAKINPF